MAMVQASTTIKSMLESFFITAWSELANGYAELGPDLEKARVHNTDLLHGTDFEPNRFDTVKSQVETIYGRNTI